MKCRKVKPKPSSLLCIIICLGKRVLRTKAEAVWTVEGSNELSRLEDEPGGGVGDKADDGVHVCSRCNLAASCKSK